MAATKKEKLESLQDLYLHELKDVYSAEKQITKALPKVIKACNSEELKEAFKNHLAETEEQVKRIETILERLGKGTTGPKCKGMEGLISEADDFMKEEAFPQVSDAGIIVAAQKVEHYEIAAYGSLCTFAEILGYEEDLELLKQTMAEEEEADRKLTEIADSQVNEEAESGGSYESEEEGAAHSQSRSRK